MSEAVKVRLVQSNILSSMSSFNVLICYSGQMMQLQVPNRNQFVYCCDYIVHYCKRINKV